LWIFAIVAVLMAVLFVLFERTRIGGRCWHRRLIAMPALDGHRPAAHGARSRLPRAALAGVAGTTIAPIALVSLRHGRQPRAQGFRCATLGGIGSVPGAVVGGILMG